MSNYPRDEFDQAAQTGPAGAHRAMRPRWQTYLPFLVVLIVAPLLAWGVVWLMKQSPNAGNVKTPPAASQTQKATENQSAEDAKAKEEAAAQAKAKAEAELKEAKANGNVSVLNVQAGNGAAGRAAEKLKADGFVSVGAGNAPDAQVNTTKIFYSDTKYEAAAKRAAELLGIATTELSQQAAEDDALRIFLFSDYKEAE